MTNIVPQQIPVWNQFDEFGILAGLAHWSPDHKTLSYVRYPGESNKLLKDRTLQANAYRGNSTLQGMINNISRDLSVSVSGNYILPIYNTTTKSTFYLSQKPYPSASGINVFVSSSGSWSSADQVFPQVRASGYSTATSGWILWNLPDFDPSLIPSGLPGSSGWFSTIGIPDQFPSGVQIGEYLQVLEFIGSSIPDTGDKIRVDYQVQTGIDIYGQVTLDWRTDFSHPEDPTDLTFVGSKSDFPTNSGTFSSFQSGHISIFTLNQLSDPTISGVFFTPSGKPTAKLIEIANLVNKDYPLYWDQFVYDIGTWDQLNMAAVGSVPSFHDEIVDNVSGYPIQGGSRYGIDLNCVKLYSTNSNARTPWYPLLSPGEFHICRDRYYLFGSMQYTKVNLVLVSGILSGNIPLDSTTIIYSGNASFIGLQGFLIYDFTWNSGDDFTHVTENTIITFGGYSGPIYSKISNTELLVMDNWDPDGGSFDFTYTVTTTFPTRLGLIAGYSSGIFFTDSKLPNNPYIKRLHDFNKVISGVYYHSPYVSYAPGFSPSNFTFDGNNFYFDYNTGNIYASGINPSGFVLAWEHSDVYGSGLLVQYSGGYGLTTFDFNPLTNPSDKVLYLN